MRPILEAANLTNLSAERNPPTIYIQDPERRAPYAMMVKMPELMAKAEGVDQVKSIGWKHGDLSESAIPIESVKIDWPAATYEAIWNEAEERFDLNFDGETNISESGARLGSNMQIIQIIEITPSEFGDKFGGVTPKSHVVGSGNAYLLRDGTVTKVQWSRADASSPTNWILPDGSPAYFATGQVWVFLTDREPVFTYPTPEPEK